MAPITDQAVTRPWVLWVAVAKLRTVEDKLDGWSISKRQSRRAVIHTCRSPLRPATSFSTPSSTTQERVRR